MHYWLGFYRGEGRFWKDKVVHWITNSQFSHCELIRSPTRPFPGETHLCITASGRDGGVRQKEITFEAGKWDFIPVPWAGDDAWDRVAEHLGKGYDRKGMVLTHVMNLRIHDETKWFCSKICAHALHLSEPHTYSPGDLRRVVLEHTRTWRAGHRGLAPSVGYVAAEPRQAPMLSPQGPALAPRRQ